eukprot:6491883-Amphidinium_carterae.1
MSYLVHDFNITISKWGTHRLIWLSVVSHLPKIVFWWGLRKHPPMLRLQTGASEDDEQINPTQNMH